MLGLRVLCYDGNAPLISSCILKSNYARAGGAVAAFNNSAPTIIDCESDSNAAKRGSAFAIYEGTVHFSSSDITANTASTGGGGIALNYKGDYDSANLVVSNNESVTGEMNIDDESAGFMMP
jgi:hypothetical protein